MVNVANDVMPRNRPPADPIRAPAGEKRAPDKAPDAKPASAAPTTKNGVIVIGLTMRRANVHNQPGGQVTMSETPAPQLGFVVLL